MSDNIQLPGRLPTPGDWPCQRAPMEDPPPRLLAALYVLLRDQVQPGDMEQIMLMIRDHDAKSTFTNDHLRGYALALCTYLLDPPPKHTGQPTADDECDDPNCPACGVP